MRSRRLLAWVAAVAALALLAALLYQRPGRRMESVRPSQRPDPPLAAGVDKPRARPAEAPEIARALVQPAAEPEAGPGDELPSGTALVRVRVADRERGGPVAALRCSALPEEQARRNAIEVESPRAGIGEAARTDADGRCELLVEAGCRHVIRVGPGVNYRPEPVPELVAGAVHELTLRVFVPPDPCRMGRVIDAETEGPIEGAHVEMALEETTTDARGMFRVEDAGEAVVTASGYGQRSVWLDEGRETEETAAVVRLMRAGSIEITVRDASGAPVAEVRSVARTDAYRLMEQGGSQLFFGSDPTWSAHSGTDGRCVLVDLPPRVPISIVLHRGEELVHRVPMPIDLAPGETRTLEIQLGSGTTLRGTVLDQAEVPIASLRLWLVPAPGNMPVFQAREREVAAKVTTDGLGRFEIADVPAGSWWLGPEPFDRDQAPEPDSVARTTELVQVADRVPVVDVVLHFDRGLFLSGRVLDPEGLPAASVFVSALLHEVATLHTVDTQTDLDGAFSLGPLRSGRYRVTAGGPGGPHARALPVEAEAGAIDLVLQLRLSGRVSGTVVDKTTGKPLSGRVDCAIADDSVKAFMMTVTYDGAFSFEGLAPGRYTFGARTDAGQYGFSKEVEVAGAESLEGVRIETTPGGRLRIRYEGAEADMGFLVWAQGLHMAEGALHASSPSECSVPADVELLVELKRRPEGLSRTVRVAAGETVEVVLGDE